MAISVLGNRHAIDELHDEVREPILGSFAAVEPRDVGVVEIGEYLTLVAKALENVIGVHPALDYFNRDAAVILIVIAFRQIDRAHASGPNQVEHSERSYSATSTLISNLLSDMFCPDLPGGRIKKPCFVGLSIHIQ